MEKEPKVSLYQMTEALQVLENMEDEDMEPYLESLELQIENKVDSIVKYRQNLTAGAFAITQEIERLNNMKKVVERRAERLKEIISRAMIAHDIKEVKTDLFKVSFLKSEAVLVDEALLDEKYLITKVTKQADKVAIKKAIKNGEEVIGASLEQRQNLQIS
jgi:hypothetical protein